MIWKRAAKSVECLILFFLCHLIKTNAQEKLGLVHNNQFLIIISDIQFYNKLFT